MTIRTIRFTPAACGALLSLLAAGAAAPNPALAQITTFTGADPTAGTAASPRPNSDAAAAQFANAVATLGGTPVVVSFEGVAIGALTGATSAGVGGGVTAAVSNNGGSGVTTNGSGYNLTPGGSRFLDLRPGVGSQPYSVTFTFAAPINAFGFYLFDLSEAGTFNVTFNDGTARTLTAPAGVNGGTQFFGFTDTLGGITSVQLTRSSGTGDFVGIDDVRFNSVGAVNAAPEPGALALALTAALSGAVPLARRKGSRRL